MVFACCCNVFFSDEGLSGVKNIPQKYDDGFGPQEIIANHSRASPNLQPLLKAVIWYGIVRIWYGCGTSMAWYGRQCSNKAAKITWARLSIQLERTIFT